MRKFLSFMTVRAALLTLVASVAAIASASLDGPAPLAWRWSPISAAVPTGAPVVNQFGAFVAIGNRVYGIDRESGNTLWRYPQSEPLTSKVATSLNEAGELVVCGLEDGQMIAINSISGEQKWHTTLESKPVTKIVKVGDAIVFGNQLNQLMALNAADGKPYWKDPVRIAGVLNPNLVPTEDGLLYTVGQKLIYFDVKLQKQRWEKVFTTIGGDFTVVGDRIYVNSSTYLSVLRLSTGGKVWQTNVGEALAGPPTANSSYAVTVSRSGILYVLDYNGKQVFKKGVDIGAPTYVSPVISDHNAIVATQNGTIAMVDVRSGDLIWNTGIPLAIKPKKPTSGGITAGAGRQTTSTVDEIKFVQPAGNPVLAGESLFILARDGTLLAYDRQLGVDLTAPEVSMVWPNAGDVVAGKAPMELIFKITDDGVGVSPDTVKVTINDKPYISKFSREGYLSVLISVDKKNSPLADGRVAIVVHASDWLNNKVVKRFVLTIDNSLPPLGSPKSKGSGARPGTPPPAGGGDQGGGNQGGGGDGG